MFVPCSTPSPVQSQHVNFISLVYLFSLSFLLSSLSFSLFTRVPLIVWAQTGSYVLIAILEIFAVITSMEYAYSKARRNMRSLIQAINMFTNAISAAIAEALITLSRDPLLIWNYAVFAILTFVGGTLFIIQFWGLDKEEDELNNLPGGHVQVSETTEGQAEFEHVEIGPSRG